MAAFETQN